MNRSLNVEASTQDEADWEMRIDWVAAQSKRVFAGKPGLLPEHCGSFEIGELIKLHDCDEGHLSETAAFTMSIELSQLSIADTLRYPPKRTLTIADPLRENGGRWADSLRRL
jgi:hypothetical protein